MPIVSDINNEPEDIGLEPPLIQDTGPLIQSWAPVEHQHKSQLNIPTVGNMHVPVFDIYITVNPNMNKYTKYSDQIFETSTMNNDLTINEYLNQQNRISWDTEDLIARNNINSKLVKPGPVQFVKGSQDQHRNKISSIYRGYVYPSPSSHLIKVHEAGGGQHQPLKYTIQQKNYYDGIGRDYQKNTWREQDTNQNNSYNSGLVAWDKPNELKQDTAINNLDNSFLGYTPSLDEPRYPQYKPQDDKYNTLNTKPQVFRPEEVLLNTFPAYNHQLFSPVYAHKAHETPKEIAVDKDVYRPNLKNTTCPKELKQLHEQKQIIKDAQEIEDQPEVYPDLKINKIRKYKLKKKHGSLENVLVEQKNVDDLVEQRNDLSQEIYEQNFIHFGKERTTIQGHEKKSDKESKEQSEEVPPMWDQTNQENGSKWHSNIDHLNKSVQKLRNHKQAVEEYIYANTGTVLLDDNDAIKQNTNEQKQFSNKTFTNKNFSRVPIKLRAGDTAAIELAYLKEIQRTTTTTTPKPVEKPAPPVPSPLWSAMESYYTFAKEIIVSWFN